MNNSNSKQKTFLINKIYSLHPIHQDRVLLLNKEIIDLHIKKFFKELMPANKGNNIGVLFRVVKSNNEILTLDSLKKFNFDWSDIDNYINHLGGVLTFKSDHYKTESIKAIIISYFIKNGEITTDFKAEVKSDMNMSFSFSHYKLPISFEPWEYKNIVKFSNYWLRHYMAPLKDNYFIKIKYLKSKSITQCQLMKENKVILEYQDTKIDDTTAFGIIRKINKNKYTFILGKLELTQSEKLSKFINPLKKNKNNKFNFLTLDIETYLDKNNYQTPYCICIYDGKEDKVFKFYLDDFNNSDDMIKHALESICKRNYDGYNIYAHNFSSFDGIFLLKILNEIGIVNPIIKDGKILSINFTFQSSGKKVYHLKFFDSYLLLQSNLRKLAKSFNTITKKGNFVTTKVNQNNYISLKEEVISYCIDDCKSLYQILIKFNQIINERYNINIKNYSTLPSLTFGNFKTNYLEDKQIAQISGKIENDIRKSFTGGAVDMYIPSNNQDEKLISLDVNSLYPFVMKNFEFPVGNPTYFKGDIRKIHKNSFGVFHCEITSPKYLEHPIIQTHVKTKAGIRTIAPLGHWFDWICSPEMDNAINYGYKFKIIEGYTFDKGRPFLNYIQDLYNLRLNYPKSDPMNYIAKLLMNAFYGRFGMKDSFNEIRIVNDEILSKLTDDININIKDIINLDNDYLVQIQKNEEQEIISLIDNLNENHNINIAIASFITSYARIFMSQFKNNPLIKLFYTDTDSIVISLESLLNNKFLLELIDSKILGKLKIENNISKAIFLAPKLYCLLTNENGLITKTRGLSHDIQLNLEDFDNLLFKDSEIIKNQSKWFKDIYQGTIKIEDLPYSIKYTDNKRKLIFEDGKLESTKPFIINSNKEIINKS